MILNNHKSQTEFAKAFILLFFMLVFGIQFCPFHTLAAVNDASVEGGNCRGCHREEQVLPPSHPDTTGQQFSECRECHDAPELSLSNKMTSSHFHNLSGISCTDCHDENNFSEPADKDQCLDCHGSPEEMASLTADQDPNPHDSIHYGPDLDCDLCHHIHRKSENFCNQCHEFDLSVP